MSQISSLEQLTVLGTQNVILTTCPGAENCLRNLSELGCCSDACPEFFYKLSQICHNIQILSIGFQFVISNGLADLIAVQRNLKHLDLKDQYSCENFTDIIPLLMKIPNSLTTFYLKSHDKCYIPLSFITKFTNLQEITLRCYNAGCFEDFKKLQYATFSQLQILKIQYGCPKFELLINFLEINGETLKNFV